MTRPNAFHSSPLTTDASPLTLHATIDPTASDLLSFCVGPNYLSGYLVDLVCFIYLVSFVQPKSQTNQKDQINQITVF
jgi:hypothetical protein